jgi:formate--tetrahydrofolate ligase
LRDIRILYFPKPEDAVNDIEIASRHKMLPIIEIAKNCGISEDRLELYGKYKAKVLPLKSSKRGKLILVTAINPTPLGEGKTTISIGLADGLRQKGLNAGLALREPSLGPVFGIKGGATGGGYAQVVPMEDINLHFTGDIAAVTCANNILSSIIDNHIFQGNELNIDKENIIWHRCLDLNDRALRYINVGGGGEKNGVPRADSFDITAASEIMAILCLAKDIEDLKKRLGDIIIGYDYDGNPVYARQLKAENAMAILLKDAIKPNLVQTLEGTPAFIHGGPFANIAHGCNSIIATETALSLFDYTVTEAGFGADLGAEKFLDFKCRLAGLNVNAVVIVATVKALKYGGGMAKDQLSGENYTALKTGLENLEKHIENIKLQFKLPVCVAINRYTTDRNEEIEEIKKTCQKYGVKALETTVWANGGKGADALAAEVIRLCDNSSGKINFTYSLDDSIQNKIEAIVTKIYGGKKVIYSENAQKAIERILKTGKGYEKLPVIIAKSQYSLSSDPKALGRPRDFDFYVKNVYLRGGAGFIVVTAGDIMLMPGLPKSPASDNMTIKGKENGDYEITGLF